MSPIRLSWRWCPRLRQRLGRAQTTTAYAPEWCFTGSLEALEAPTGCPGSSHESHRCPRRHRHRPPPMRLSSAIGTSTGCRITARPIAGSIPPGSSQAAIDLSVALCLSLGVRQAANGCQRIAALVYLPVLRTMPVLRTGWPCRLGCRRL